MAPEPGKESRKQSGNSPESIPARRIIAYNLRESERPGGMKVRYKIKIITGRKARDLDARQADVIKELLQWARQHQASQEGKR